jgi:hypothetical protein
MRKRRQLVLLVAIFSVLFLIPIWTVKYLPLQDWPIFMGYSYIAANISQFPSFQLKPFPPPYSTGFFLLAGLMRLFPPYVAGKIVLSIYIIAFLSGLCYFLNRLNPEAIFFFFFAPLLVFNYFFAKGNISFILSIPLFLFAIPYFVRNPGNRWHTLLISFVFALSIYFTHFFTYLAFLLIVFLLLVSRKKGLVALLVSMIPAFLFVPYFIANKAPLELLLYRSIFTKFISFRDVLGTWHPYLDVTLLAIPFLGLLGFAIMGWKQTRMVWKIALLVLFILFLLSPMEIYTLTRADQRFLPFMFFVLLLFPKDKELRIPSRLFVCLLILLSLVNLVAKQMVFMRLQTKINSCICILNEVDPHKAVVNMGTKDYYIGVINPFLHILDYRMVLQNSARVPSYEWNVPIRSSENFPVADVDDHSIRNMEQLRAHYDYFFVMEKGIGFERQLEEHAELIASDGEMKLLKKK